MLHLVSLPICPLARFSAVQSPCLSAFPCTLRTDMQLDPFLLLTCPGSLEVAKYGSHILSKDVVQRPSICKCRAIDSGEVGNVCPGWWRTEIPVKPDIAEGNHLSEYCASEERTERLTRHTSLRPMNTRCFSIHRISMILSLLVVKTASEWTASAAREKTYST